MNETPQNIETTRPEFDDFGAHYDAEIKPLLIQKEAERYHRIKIHNAFIGWSWVIVPLVAILWAIFVDQGDSFLGTIFIGLGGGYFLAKLFMHQFRSKVMQHIVGTTARFLDWKHQTDPDNFVIPDAFEDFGLIPDSLTAPKISMAVDGKIQNTDINLYKIKVQRYGRGNEDFAGLIMIMDFHRNFLGNTVILRNEETAFQFGKHDLKPVKLVDPVFEKTFDVYGDDQVEARYLLDPVFMEKLLDLEVLLMQSTKTERRKPHLKKNSTIPERLKQLASLLFISTDHYDYLESGVKEEIKTSTGSLISYIKAIKLEDIKQFLKRQFSFLLGSVWLSKSKHSSLSRVLPRYSRAAFVDGKFLLAVQSPDLWEPGSMQVPLVDLQRTQNIVREFELILDIVDHIEAKSERPA